MSGHYDETALQEYLDDPQSFAGREALEAHVALCRSCAALLEELRAFEVLLSSEAVWQTPEGGGEPPEEIRALSALLGREDEEAARLLTPLLASPVSFRRAGVTSMPALRTAGAVRRLCAESRELRERQPMHALVVADAAIAIADQLVHYPQAILDELRGSAWLERANVLRILGRYPEAFDACDIAARAFSRAPAAAWSLALVDYLRGVICVETGRADEALRLVRKAARVFRQLGEEDRYVHARMVEATVLFDRSRYGEARELFASLVPVARELGDAATLARLYGNVANCQLRLDELESAEVYFERALSLYEAMGLETERIRTRWSIGCLRIAAGDAADGVARLREARRELEELGMRSDAALVTLDLAEALLATGDPAAAREAGVLCSAIVESFTSVGMSGHALAALAFLHEAFERGKATPELVRHVRDYLGSRPDQSDTPFLPPMPL